MYFLKISNFLAGVFKLLATSVFKLLLLERASFKLKVTLKLKLFDIGNIGRKTNYKLLSYKFWLIMASKLMNLWVK